MGVDNDKMFEQLVYEEDDFKMGGDELQSNLNQEIKEVQELKKQLKSQCIESSQLIKKMNEQNTKNNELELRLKNELKQLKDVKSALNAEKQQFVEQKLELKQLLESMQKVPSNVQKSSELIEKLDKFYMDTSSVEAELD